MKMLKILLLDASIVLVIYMASYIIFKWGLNRLQLWVYVPSSLFVFVSSVNCIHWLIKMRDDITNYS